MGFQWCIRQSAEVVNQMVSVERVLAFSKLEQEAELTKDTDEQLLLSTSSPSISLGKGGVSKEHCKDHNLNNHFQWPNNGHIEVSDLSVRYRSTLPLALKKVSFVIP